MSEYIVSARKYRPTTFESVVGQKALTETLRNAIRLNKLAHAYLFCGPRGVGKTTCARIFAKTINCLQPTESHDACNECESCMAFNEQRSFNIHELDAASNNSVEDIRTLIQEVRIPPQIGKYSVYIIDEVHMLSQGAFNALLKTLEEPPSYAVFILATTEKHKVLPTILSRCQVYDFQRITVRDTVEHLKYVAAQEGIEADEQALSVVAEKADGGMRDALSIFDQLVAFSGQKITYERTIEVLNVLDTDYYFRLVQAALAHDVSAALLLLDEVLQKGFDAGHFIAGLMSHLRNVLVSKDAATVALLETSDAIRRHYAEQAQFCAASWLFEALEILNTADVQYRTAKHKRLTVELALIRLCRIGAAPVPAATQPAAQTAKPQPAPQPTKAQPTASVHVAPPPITPRVTPTASQPVPSSMPKMPSVNVQPVAQPSPQEAAPLERGGQSSPFGLDQLRDAWIGLSREFPKEKRLQDILRTCQPELSDGYVLTLTLINPWQKEEILHHQNRMLEYLRIRLHNDLITIRVQVAEYATDSKPFTAAEKYKLMIQHYPELSEVKQLLKLQLD